MTINTPSIGDKLIWPDRNLYWDWEYIGSGKWRCCASRVGNQKIGEIFSPVPYLWSDAWVLVKSKEFSFDKLYLTLKDNHFNENIV